jgi:hypothetical protein
MPVSAPQTVSRPAEAASQRRAPPPVGIRTGRRRPRLGSARREHPRSPAGRDPASRQLPTTRSLRWIDESVRAHRARRVTSLRRSSSRVTWSGANSAKRSAVRTRDGRGPADPDAASPLRPTAQRSIANRTPRLLINERRPSKAWSHERASVVVDPGETLEDGTPTPFSERRWIATLGICPNRRPRQTARCRHARPRRASVRSSSRRPTSLPMTMWTTSARRLSRRAIRRAGGAGTEPAMFLPQERSFGYDWSHARLTLTRPRASLFRWALSVFMSPPSRGASRNVMGRAPHRDRVASLP